MPFDYGTMISPNIIINLSYPYCLPTFRLFHSKSFQHNPQINSLPYLKYISSNVT